MYDDQVPSLEEMLDVTNIWSSEKHVFGNSRYNPTFWGSSARVIVWLLNKDQLPSWANWEADPRPDEFLKFLARFNIIRYCGPLSAGGLAEPVGDASDWEAVEVR